MGQHRGEKTTWLVFYHLTRPSSSVLGTSRSGATDNRGHVRTFRNYLDKRILVHSGHPVPSILDNPSPREEEISPRSFVVKYLLSGTSALSNSHL